MREIKFRAWNGRAMEYGGFSVHACGGVVGSSLGKVEDACKDVMQYTGLKDKNGKEIYEGDILEWRNHFLEVLWGSCGWVLKSKVFSRFGLKGRQPCSEINTMGYLKKSVVIGTIYENPELIGDT